MECQRFRTYLRSLEFVNQSLEEYGLNDNLKNFTFLAKQARQNFITEVFINKKNSPLFRPIPVLKQEAEAQESEENMTKPEILLKIGSLLEQLGENARKKYSGLKSKKKNDLLYILQEIKLVFDSDNDLNNQDCLE